MSSPSDWKHVPFRGHLYRASGATLLALGFLAFVLFNIPETQGTPDILLFLGLLAILFIATGAALFVRGKKVLAIAAAVAGESDPRPPVLYLRSFGDERLISRRNAIYRWLSPALAWATIKTQEESLAEVLGSLGTVVALGRPGEALPELGAARVYVADEEWQQTVTDLIKRAQLIVLRGGQSEGLKWELSKVVAECSPMKVLLTLPPGKDYDSFREWASRVLPQPLPAKRPSADYIAFDAAWSLVPLPMKSTLLDGSMSGSGSDRIARAIGAHFAAAGYPMPAPRPRVRLVRIAALFALMFLLFVAVAVLLILWRGH